MTENGWPPDTKRFPGAPISRDQLVLVTIPGTALRLQFQVGIPAIILPAFMADLNEFIEPVMNARGITDEGSFTPSNSVSTSNHLGASAFDYNWEDHPLHVKDGGWGGSVLIQGSQVPALRELLAWYEGMVFWGNDWTSPIDSMHFQMGYKTFEDQARCWNFIARKIRADGFSTYRRGGVARGGGPINPNPIKPKSGLTAQVLWDIAGRPERMPLARYEELLPIVRKMLVDMGANTIDRRAMAIAQTFHESGALYYKREIHDGSNYEGRCKDLGNCQPGDGTRFPGRGFIQLTGRAHAAGFSGWMFRRGLAPTPTHFVDHPELMETDENAVQVVVYYWTVSRPQLNSLADARNLEGATRAVNGGLNGLADRKKFYERALAANADLLDPIEPADPWEELLMLKVKSMSIYAEPGEGPIPVADMIAALDAHGPHEPYEEGKARAGNIASIRKLARTAAGRGADHARGPEAIQQAAKVLAEINAAHPEYILAAIPGKA